MDVKHHIVHDAVKVGVVRIEVSKSGEKHTDIATKYLGEDNSEEHAAFKVAKTRNRG